MRPSFAALTFIGLAVTTVEAQTFTRVIGSGDLAPGTSAPISTFTEAPGLDDGHIAFLASHQAGGGFVQTVYSNATGSFQKVISTGDPMPGHGAVPLQFLIRLTLDGDHIAIQGSSFVGGIARNAILSNGSGAVLNVADQGNFIPGTFSKFTQIAGQDFSFGRGRVVFNGSGPSQLRGLYAVASTGGPLSVVADSTMVAPNSGGATYFSFGTPAVRDDRVGFHSSLSSGQLNVFDQFGAGSGPVTNTVSLGDLAPSGQPFTFLFEPKVDEDDTAFYGWAGGVTGLYAIVDGAMSTIADSTMAIPGGTGTFAEFFEWTISNERVVFDGHQAALEGTQHAGVFTNVCGGVARILGPGDALDGKTVSYVTIDEDSLDEDLLAMNVAFTDGNSGIYLADLTSIGHSGQGFAPAGTTVPRLEGIGCPALGAPLTFHLRGAPVGGTGLFIIGASPTSVPAPGGGTLLATPDWVSVVTANAPNYGHPDGWFDAAVTIPTNVQFSGTTFAMQAAWMDPAQPGPWRLTDRLEVAIP